SPPSQTKQRRTRQWTRNSRLDLDDLAMMMRLDLDGLAMMDQECRSPTPVEVDWVMSATCHVADSPGCISTMCFRSIRARVLRCAYRPDPFHQWGADQKAPRRPPTTHRLGTPTCWITSNENGGLQHYWPGPDQKAKGAGHVPL